jgi:hypothetical protein
VDEISTEAAEMRAIAAALLRAHRHNDRTAFMSAMQQAEKRVPDLLISMCFIANEGMERVLSREQVDALIAELVTDLPEPRDRTEIAADAWLDAIALCEAATRGDADGGRVILLNSPDLTLLFGNVMQLLALLLPEVPEDIISEFFLAARELEPPSA